MELVYLMNGFSRFSSKWIRNCSLNLRCTWSNGKVVVVSYLDNGDTQYLLWFCQWLHCLVFSIMLDVEIDIQWKSLVREVVLKINLEFSSTFQLFLNVLDEIQWNLFWTALVLYGNLPYTAWIFKNYSSIYGNFTAPRYKAYVTSKIEHFKWLNVLITLKTMDDNELQEQLPPLITWNACYCNSKASNVLRKNSIIGVNYQKNAMFCVVLSSIVTPIG